MWRRVKVVLLVILAAIFVGEAALAVVVVLRHSKNHTSGTTSTSSQTAASSPNTACSIFTLAEAKQVLKGDVVGGSQVETSSSPDIQVSGCSYKLSSAANTTGVSVQTASLIVHRPTNNEGIASNQRNFSDEQPLDAVAVTDYGDKAYWDGQFGQLNILKHNVWYVLSYGPASPTERSLDQTRQLADILASQF